MSFRHVKVASQNAVRTTPTVTLFYIPKVKYLTSHYSWTRKLYKKKQALIWNKQFNWKPYISALIYKDMIYVMVPTKTKRATHLIFKHVVRHFCVCVNSAFCKLLSYCDNSRFHIFWWSIEFRRYRRPKISTSSLFKLLHNSIKGQICNALYIVMPIIQLQDDQCFL